MITKARRPSGSAGSCGGRRSSSCDTVSPVEADVCQLSSSKDLLLPLSPTLPLLSPVFTSVLRGITTAEYLHQPYFDIKGMDRDAVWRWIEERKWAYRGEGHTKRTRKSALTIVFGFAASLLERIPIIGLFLSISNRIGAAMW